MPKIDSARINALRAQPKPLANPLNTTNTHSEDTPEPMEVDKAPMGRTLRKRKEKVAKHLKRGANEKEMDSFLMKPQTSSRRINDPELIATCHCGAEYETKYSASIKTHTPTSIDNANQKSIDNHLKQSIDSSSTAAQDDWPPKCYPSFALKAATSSQHLDEYDEDYEEERATEYRETVIHEPGVDELHEGFTTEELLNHQERSDTDSLFAEACGRGTRFYRPFTKAKRPSIDNKASTSIDNRPKRPSTVSEKAKQNNNDLPPDEFGIFRDPKSYARAMDGHALQKDEYGVYRDLHGHARGVDGHIIHVSKDDIRNLLETASMDEHSYICLPEHERSFTHTKLVPEIYTKDEINEMLYEICGVQGKNEDDFQMKLDGVYYLLNDNISWLTTCLEEMRQDIATMQTQRATEATTLMSLDRNISTSIDDDPPP
ncbi:hypothetical protein F2Q69_00035949 [Brassica cretica]|uniref:Uncharacterized protein n=1 Tax=Brassica cretica TaxID=69181 RepID=A0A8S9SAN6_BRACR|nr:hypothetical protein F2Q69_00035949 [Brassica cretica]